MQYHCYCSSLITLHPAHPFLRIVRRGYATCEEVYSIEILSEEANLLQWVYAQQAVDLVKANAIIDEDR